MHKLKLPERPSQNAVKSALAVLAVPALVPALVPPLVSAITLAVPAAPKTAPVKDIFLEDFSREEAYDQIKQFMKAVKAGICTKPLLVLGPTGTGKTVLIEHLADKFSVSLDFANEDDLEVEAFTTSFRKGPLVFDAVESFECKSMIKNMLPQHERPTKKQKKESGIKPPIRPLLFISDDPFHDFIKLLMKTCSVVRLEKASKMFLNRCIKAWNPALNDFEVADINGMCNGSLAVAKYATQWTMRISNSKAASAMHVEVPLDVPRATRMLLMGQDVKCFGDSSFLLQQLQTNVVPNCQDSAIKKLARSLDAYSQLELYDSRHILDTEMIWTSLGCIAADGPKAKSFTFHWPRSTKALENPEYSYN